MSKSRREVIAGAAVLGISAIAVAAPQYAEAAVETLPTAPGAAVLDYPLFGMTGNCGMLSDAIHDWLNDAVLDKGFYPGYVNLTRDGYKQAARGGLIDFIPDSEGKVNIPVVHGLRVFVPGSKLGQGLTSAKDATGKGPFTSFRVAAAPAGERVFDADASGYHMSEKLLDYFSDQRLDGAETHSVYLTRDAFKQAARDRMLDWIREEYLRDAPTILARGPEYFCVPTLWGRRVYVVVGPFGS